MNDIYQIKYKKYKQKYILLKQLIQEGGGGFIDFIGEGASGCLLCPPIEFTNIPIKYETKKYNPYTNYKIPDFSFDKIQSCDYVGKILAIKDQGYDFDSYENEFAGLKIIKNLDPNGNYTPQLIYANIHLKNELLEKLKDNKDLYDCVNNKIKIDKFGYIISKHTGKSLRSKYNRLILPETDIGKLKKFLNKFNELLEFIKKLYDNNYLHLDIKINNITIKEEEDDKLYLIDFGRTRKINDYNYHDIIQYYFMYSFEPKIYINLLKANEIKFLTYISFKNLIKYVDENFDNLIFPYNNKSNDNKILHNILLKVFQADFERDKTKWEKDKQNMYTSLQSMLGFFSEEKEKEKYIDIYHYINYRQKEYFIKYLYKMSYSNNGKETQTVFNNIFYPIIKKYDMYCIGIILAEIVLLYHDFDKCNNDFKEKFTKLIIKLLFHEFDKVDYIISEINELIKLI
jgi:tRNA A-37 threonylcarbamoyl transferase component Bud32